jgi:hypothetical protein
MIDSPLRHTMTDSNAERRLSTRHVCAGTSVKAVVLLGGEPCSTMIQNVSAGGLGVVLDAIVAPNEWLNVELRNSPGGVWFYKQVRVVHVWPARPGRWLLGGAFDQALSLEELRRLLSHSDKASVVDRFMKRR